MPAWTPDPDLERELDRVGVSHAKAGAADYVMAAKLGDRIWLLGPPRLRPRPQWDGSLEQALVLLATLPDDAGPEAFWEAFGGDTSETASG